MWENKNGVVTNGVMIHVSCVGMFLENLKWILRVKYSTFELRSSHMTSDLRGWGSGVRENKMLSDVGRGVNEISTSSIASS